MLAVLQHRLLSFVKERRADDKVSRFKSMSHSRNMYLRHTHVSFSTCIYAKCNGACKASKGMASYAARYLRCVF